MKYTLEHVRNKHLTICERTLIQFRLKDGHTVYSIAKEIGCAYNTSRTKSEEAQSKYTEAAAYATVQKQDRKDETRSKH